MPTDGTGKVEIDYDIDESLCLDPYDSVELSVEFSGTGCLMTGTYDGKPLKADLTDAEDQRVNASWSQATMQATNCQGKVGGQDVTLLNQDNQRKIVGYHNTL